MRIGVDASCWSNKRGFGRFTRELLESLLEVDGSNEYLFFIDSHSPELDDMPRRAKKVVARTEFSQVKAAASDGRRSISDLWAMSREVFKHKIDLFFFPAVYSYFPIFNRTKIVLTLHDVIAEHHPELIFPNKKYKLFWDIKNKLAIRQADIVATVSEHSKAEIIDQFKLPPSRLRIISEASRPVFKVLSRDNGFVDTLANYGLHPHQRFLLYVGGISPHKNLNTLVDAFRLIVGRQGAGIKLVLVGDFKDDPFFSAYPDLRDQIRTCGLENSVVFTGYIPDEDLAYLYNAAAMLVFPSLEEGFGLPALEAMSCGTPVAASSTGSLPEVIGSAGRFFDPKSASDMADVITNVLADEVTRARMKREGLERSRTFGWKRAAEDALAIFNEFRRN